MDLTARCRVGSVDDYELVLFLTGLFRRGSFGEDATFSDSEDPEQWAVRAEYAEKRLKAVVSGPGLTATRLAEIEAGIEQDLLGSGRQIVGRSIVFAAQKVENAFVIPGRLQLIPAPPQAPRPPYAIGEHPLVLECLYRYSKSHRLSHSRRTDSMRSWSLVLNLLFYGGIRMEPRGDHVWVYATGLGSRDRCSFLQPGYAFDGFATTADAFSNVAGMPAMVAVNAEQYYWRHPGYVEALRCSSIAVPLLTVFDGLGDDKKQVFLRAAYWYHAARRVARESSSAAFVATVSAIETLIPKDPDQRTCETCGKSRAKGITARFVDFLERSVPETPANRNARKAVYTRRSLLAHGEALFRQDQEYWISHHPQARDEQGASGYALALAQAALINWLAAQSPTPEPVVAA